jgi:hypothetical protein
MDWVDRTPLWIVGLSCMAGLIVAHEFGYRAGRRFVPRDGHTDAKGYLVSSALSLASLMMAFTFGAAQTDFRLRQGLVSAEANAIGTAYLRIQTLDQPARDQLSQHVLRYARVRGGSTARPEIGPPCRSTTPGRGNSRRGSGRKSATRREPTRCRR